MEASRASSSILRYLLLWICLVLVQVLVCDHMMLFGVAFPFLFIYLILCLPMNIGLNWLLTIAFLTGLCIDVFSDNLGLNSFCCVIMAILRKPVFYAYITKEDRFRDVEPSVVSLGWNNFMKYAVTLTAIYSFLAFAIEYFSIQAFGIILVDGFFSTLLTFFLMLGVDALFKKSSRDLR